MFANQLEPFSGPAYILIFITLWICVCKLISVFDGWKTLSQDYQTNSAFDGQKLWFRSVGMRRGTNYSSCITLGVNKYGLYISILPIFRVGHPPLFIPWTDISTEEANRHLLPDVVKFYFAKQSEVPVILSKKLAAKIIRMRQDSQPGFSV
jgi:hypothetical protein